MRGVAIAVWCAAALAATHPAWANLVITPTFDTSITSDPNAATIEATIDSAILTYEDLFSNPIDVPITFQEGSGLGSSAFSLFDVSYASFSTALHNNAQTTQNANQLAAVAANPIASVNPVTGTKDILMKCATIDAVFGAGSSGCASDGTITLNTSQTFPGSPGTGGGYSLLAVAEHEIDEILGLGSTLGLGIGGYTCATGVANTSCGNVPSPEDLFRYTAAGARSFSTAATAYFSINGSTDLAQYNNNAGGDYGDWASFLPGVGPQVQDAYASIGATPALGNEITALNVIGYDLIPAPEPGTVGVLLVGLAGLAGLRRQRARA